MAALGTLLDPGQSARLGREAKRAPEHWLGLRQPDFDRHYNRRPFLLEHRLADHPLFQRRALFELCLRHPRASVALRAGEVPVTEDFAGAFVRYGKGLELEDTLENFEARGAYLVVTNPERDARYREAIEALLGEVAERTEQVDPGITWYSTYLFISSRESLTPYHMDREMNFFFQVCGAKQVKLWDPADGDVVTQQEKDALLAHDAELRPPYSPAIEPKAQVFELSPGLGVHFPFIAPHVVRTLSSFSVSLALTIRTRRSDTWTAAHRLNHALRRRGLEPRPVGRSLHLDSAKATVVRLLRRSRAAARVITHLRRA